MRLRGKKAIFNYDDTWNLDYTLAPVIHAGLAKFKSVICSPDNGFAKGVPSAVVSGEDYCDADWDKWLGIIDTMIFAFGEIAFGEENDKLLNKYYSDFNLSDMNGSVRGLDEFKALEERVDLGINNFGKYYRSLWW